MEKITNLKRIEISKIAKYSLIILIITVFPSIYILNSNRKLSKNLSDSIVIEKDNLNVIKKIEKALNNKNFSLLENFFEWLISMWPTISIKRRIHIKTTYRREIFE